jgi:hypothetical protein
MFFPQIKTRLLETHNIKAAKIVFYVVLSNVAVIQNDTGATVLGMIILVGKLYRMIRVWELPCRE